MIEVKICVGSSCHLKGAYQVVQVFQEMVKEYNLEERIHLKASFCTKKCTEGVTIQIGDRKVSRLSPSNAREIFLKEFMPEEGGEA